MVLHQIQLLTPPHLLLSHITLSISHMEDTLNQFHIKLLAILLINHIEEFLTHMLCIKHNTLIPNNDIPINLNKYMKKLRKQRVEDLLIRS